jgi:hypothetical protein
LLVLLAFVGTWLGHTIEYLRVNGPVGMADTMIGAVHLYMLPLAGVLLLLSLAGGIGWLRAINALARRLHRLQWALRRGHRVDGAPRLVDIEATSPMAHQCSLWLVLGLAQIGLYLIQENLESVVAAVRAPGLGPLVGQHWGAAPIHLVVAGTLAALAAVLMGYQRHLERTVERHERLVARLWPKRPGPPPAGPAEPPALTPHQRWGSQRWQRPPPVSRAA